MTIVQIVFIGAFVPTLVALALVARRVAMHNKMLNIAGQHLAMMSMEVIRQKSEIEKLSTELSKYKKKVNN